MADLSGEAVMLLRDVLGALGWNPAQCTDEEVVAFYFEDNPVTREDVEAAAAGDERAMERVRFYVWED